LESPFQKITSGGGDVDRKPATALRGHGREPGFEQLAGEIRDLLGASDNHCCPRLKAE
jgi:hypothetical protein